MLVVGDRDDRLGAAAAGRARAARRRAARARAASAARRRPSPGRRPLGAGRRAGRGRASTCLPNSPPERLRAGTPLASVKPRIRARRSGPGTPSRLWSHVTSSGRRRSAGGELSRRFQIALTVGCRHEAPSWRLDESRRCTQRVLRPLARPGRPGTASGQHRPPPAWTWRTPSAATRSTRRAASSRGPTTTSRADATTATGRR